MDAGAATRGDAVLPHGLAAWNDFFACRAFDSWVARGLARRDAPSCDAVIACEISAATTFAAAEQRGVARLLDAPSLHHLAQDRLTGVHESPRLHARLAAVKDDEIRRADHILTVSALARDSYLEAGVPAERVHAVDLGADLTLFQPPPTPPQGTDIAFLFCGAMLHRKGFDLLLAAFRSLGQEAGARLVIAGPRGDASSELDAERDARITWLGALSQGQLADAMRDADCLVLPSRHDSYGMVVAEALACGLPAIVSESVGAKTLLAQGRSGWIVPTGDASALGERLRWCAEHLGDVRAMRPDCRRAALGATWEAYHGRLVDLLRALLRER